MLDNIKSPDFSAEAILIQLIPKIVFSEMVQEYAL